MKTFQNIDDHDVRLWWVFTALKWLLSLASAAFSFSFFAGLLQLTKMPEEAIYIGAGLITIGQSIAIERGMDWLMRQHIRRKKREAVSPLFTSVAIVTVCMIVFDLFANFKGLPALVHVALKQAEYTTPAFPGEGELKSARAELEAVTAKNTWKGKVYINKQDQARYTALSNKVAEMESAKTAILATSRTAYSSEVEGQAKNAALAISLLGWFNAAAYALMFVLLNAIHRIEMQDEDASGIVAVPRKQPQARDAVPDPRVISLREAGDRRLRTVATDTPKTKTATIGYPPTTTPKNSGMQMRANVQHDPLPERVILHDITRDNGTSLPAC